ncbi:MAG: group 1 truncated hemoglobin [Burkholderiales bacterium PBB1]|nr:MAG: group 1 truncated hemoglobin [Burkholderiales bacterium PBB1]
MTPASKCAAALKALAGKRLLATVMYGLAACGAASAADAPQRPPAIVDTYIPVVPADDSLYQALGGHDGLVKIAAEFHHRLLANPQLGPYFRDIDAKQYQERLVIQFCEVSGGPCKQAKHDMRKVHSAMDINKATFNATVEVLQQSLDAQGVGYRTQNRLLAQLAPMHRDIVNTP